MPAAHAGKFVEKDEGEGQRDRDVFLLLLVVVVDYALLAVPLKPAGRGIGLAVFVRIAQAHLCLLLIPG
jgi:hypothetical protein